MFCLPGLAAAQDSVVVPAPVNLYDWNGAYIGVHGSWSHGHPDFNGEFVSPDEFHSDWYGGGVEIGYDWQAGPWVFGVVGDIDYLDMDAEERFVSNGPGKGDEFVYDLDWTASARVRAGHLFEDDRVLLYATGGLAATEVGARSTRTDALDPPITSSADKVLYGMVFGGGIEYAFAPNWTFKAEYLRYDFPSLVVPGKTTGSGINSRFEIEPMFDQVRFGIAYRF